MRIFAIGVALEKGVIDKSYLAQFVKGLSGYMAYIGEDGSVSYTCGGCLCPKQGTKKDYMQKPWFFNDPHAFGPIVLAFTQALKLGIKEITPLSKMGILAFNPDVPRKPQTYIRYMPEANQNICWENDRIAYRLYGSPAKDRVSSGLDIWTKSVSYPIIDKWYKLNGEGKEYHEDRGEGCDFFHVGFTRGNGGTAIWYNDKPYISQPYVSHKILKNTETEIAFEIQFEPWAVGNFKVSEKKVISMKMGTNFYKVVSTFETAVIGCGVVVTLYTVIGGFWAVIVTDVVQFVILFFATLILVPLSYQAAGGIENMQAVIPQNMTWFNGKKGIPIWLCTYYVLLIIRYLGNWTFIQRFYSAKSETDGQKLAVLSAVLFFIFPVIFLFPPLAARVILPDLKNPEMAYVALCVKLLPSGIMGLMIAAMFAATMSVLSAEYNVTASVLTRDIYQRVFRPNASGKEALLVGRLMTLLVGTIVTIGALFVAGFGGAFEANKLLAGIFAVPMIVPVIFGVLMLK